MLNLSCLMGGWMGWSEDWFKCLLDYFKKEETREFFYFFFNVGPPKESIFFDHFFYGLYFNHQFIHVYRAVVA
jgi:hypothetical protein